MQAVFHYSIWYLLYSLGTDRTENGASSSSVVEWHRYGAMARMTQRTHSSVVVCGVFVMLLSCLLCSNLVRALSSVIMSQHHEVITSKHER
jgi:NADH:ubiquinone oxidoreductase subunit B-like Fe-S oxidoreductase